MTHPFLSPSLPSSHHKWFQWDHVLWEWRWRERSAVEWKNYLFPQLKLVFIVIKYPTNFASHWQWRRHEFYSEYEEWVRWGYNENIVQLSSFHSNKTFTWNDSNQYHRITLLKWVYWMRYELYLYDISTWLSREKNTFKLCERSEIKLVKALNFC